MTNLEGVEVTVPKVFEDDRGYFFETWNSKKDSRQYCQDNLSFSTHLVLRGLHYQKPPFEQGKLVRCVSGEVLDVFVDIRVGSPTFGKHQSCILSAENSVCVYIPRGFAHGFLVLSGDAIFTYKCDSPYEPWAEKTIIWDDPDIGIRWGLPENVFSPMVSAKDAKGVRLLDIPIEELPVYTPKNKA